MTKVLKTYLLKITLENIQTDIHANIWAINQGGCGYFATYLAAALKKYNFKFKVAHVSRNHKFNPKFIHSNINKLNNGRCGNISASHLLINIGEMYIDGTTIYDAQTLRCEFSPNFYKLFHLNIEVDSFKQAVEKSNWNDMYDIDQNYYVEKIIFDNFKKIFG